MKYKQQRVSINIGHPGFNAANLGIGGAEIVSKWLRDQLVPLIPGGLIPASAPYRLTTPANLIDPRLSTALLLYDAVKEICAKKAISYVFDAQLGKNDEREWSKLASLFTRQVNSAFLCQRFEIDLSNPQTGYGSTTIHGGSFNVR